METIIVPGFQKPHTFPYYQLTKEAQRRNPSKRIIKVFWFNVDKDCPMTWREARIMMENDHEGDLFENWWNIEINYSKWVNFADIARKYPGAKVAYRWLSDGKDKWHKSCSSEDAQADAGDFEWYSELDLCDVPKYFQEISLSSVTPILESQSDIRMNPKNRALNKAIFKQQSALGIIWAEWAEKDKVSREIVKTAEELLWIKFSYINTDHLRHSIIGESTTESHQLIRQRVAGLFPKKRILDDDGFIKEKWRNLISGIVHDHNTDPEEIQKKELVKIATPAVQSELYHRMKDLKGCVIINNAMMAENKSTLKVNHNVVLVTSPYESKETNKKELTTHKRLQFQKKTEKNRKLIEHAIKTHETWSLTEYENSKEPWSRERKRNLTFELVRKIDVDGRHRYNWLLDRSWIKITPEALNFFDELKSHYDGEWRSYHTWWHILNNWNWIYRDHDLYTDKEDLIVAEWINIFHDYKMWFHRDRFYNDEIESARFAEQKLKELWVSNKIIDRVYYWIMKTRHQRNEPPKDMVEANFLARDLSILASDRWDYLKYSEQVREEYAHFSEEEFTYGRRLFLKKMLNSERQIFPIAHYEELGAPQEKIEELKLWETKALANMKQELIMIDAQEAHKSKDKSIVQYLDSDEDITTIKPWSWNLSMDAYAPFTINKKTYASVTAFMSWLHFVTERKRIEIANLFGEDATNSKKTAKRKLFYTYNGRTEAMWSKYHHRLLEQALDAKFNQNSEAKKALLNTSWSMLMMLNMKENWRLMHDDPFVTSKTYTEILLKLRARHENEESSLQIH